MYKVWILEDDENIRELVLYALKSSGFEGEGYETGGDFFEALSESGELPSLILMDIMLPEEDGLSVLRKMRQDAKYKAISVIMLTAKGSELDKVRGLDMGADDYIVKPFSVMELISRINAVLRRSAADGSDGALRYQNIELNSERHVVLVDGEKVVLRFKEFELLAYLLLNAGLVLSRDKIMESVWGYDFEGESRTVDMHIKTLRQKLGPAGDCIKTVRNVGYKMGE